MTYNLAKICRKFSAIEAFLLLLQPPIAQYKFDRVDNWFNDNLRELAAGCTVHL